MYDTIIEVGIIFLLMYTPIAFGGVTEYALVCLETVAGGLVIVWLLKGIARRNRLPRGVLPSPEESRNYFKFRPIPGFVIIIIFLMLVGGQLLPLPVESVKRLSPETYHYYMQAAATIMVSPPRFMPLSVCTQTTEVELYKILAYGIVFFLIINTIRTPRQIRRISTTIIGMGLLEAGYSVLQMVSGKQFLSFYKVKDYALNGSFINKNHFAGYLEMVILLSFGGLFVLFEPTTTSSSFRSSAPAGIEKYTKIILWVLALSLLISALFLSGSRGGFLSFFCGLCVFLVLSWRRRLKKKWIGIALTFLTVGLIISLFLTPMFVSKNIERFTELGSAFQARAEIWKSAWSIFEDFPIFGSGLGTFSHLVRRYQTFRTPYHFRYAESDLLQLLAETGILGTGAFTLLSILFFVNILIRWERRRSHWAGALIAGQLSAMASIMIHGIVDFNLHIPSNVLLFTVIAALSHVTVLTSESRHHGTR